MYRAWTTEFYATIQAQYPEYQNITYESATTMWRRSFTAIWPNLLEEPDSEKIKVEETKFKAVNEAVLAIKDELDPDNKARLFEWMAECFNDNELLFPSPLDLDFEAMSQWQEQEKAKQEQIASEERAMGNKPPGNDDSGEQTFADSEHWVTVEGGQNVLVDGDGQVLSGIGGKQNYQHWSGIKSKSGDVDRAAKPASSMQPGPTKPVNEKKQTQKMSEEQYLSSQSAGRGDIGEAATHRSAANISKKQWQKTLDREAERSNDVVNKRDELRLEYEEKVKSGDIEKPSMLDERIATANGHPDNESTQAARRLLDKKGIECRQQPAPEAPKDENIKQNLTNSAIIPTQSKNKEGKTMKSFKELQTAIEKAEGLKDYPGRYFPAMQKAEAEMKEWQQNNPEEHKKIQDFDKNTKINHLKMLADESINYDADGSLNDADKQKRHDDFIKQAEALENPPIPRENKNEEFRQIYLKSINLQLSTEEKTKLKDFINTVATDDDKKAHPFWFDENGKVNDFSIKPAAKLFTKQTGI
jgi:hypothetical protein